MRRISVFGLGYVGAVTAACLAKQGHHVIGVDVNPQKVQALETGRATVLEPGLEQLTGESKAAGRLRAMSDAAAAVNESEISFVCVGTPGLPNGRLNASNVSATCEQIGGVLRHKSRFHWVVIRSTILPGTTKSMIMPVLESASGKRAGRDFAVCVNPEFTREGSAVADFLNSPLTVLGSEELEHLDPLREIYRGFSASVAETSIEVAEMVKYVSNAFHALKITFANEIGTLCRHLGVDEETVMRIFMDDTKLNISSAYLTPGFAFGGSCLPKDLRALTYCAKQLDLHLPLLGAINPSNQAHLERALESVLATNRKKIAVLGLSFKSGTDDLRESPSVQLIKRLLGEGCQIRIWDSDVSLGRLVGSNRQFIEEQIPHIGSLLSSDMEAVVASCQTIVVVTKAVEIEQLVALCRPGQTILDLRSPSPSPVCLETIPTEVSARSSLELHPVMTATAN
jgi:GDP-mannose 6-dehydrogenase